MAMRTPSGPFRRFTDITGEPPFELSEAEKCSLVQDLCPDCGTNLSWQNWTAIDGTLWWVNCKCGARFAHELELNPDATKMDGKTYRTRFPTDPTTAAIKKAQATWTENH